MRQTHYSTHRECNNILQSREVTILDLIQRYLAVQRHQKERDRENETENAIEESPEIDRDRERESRERERENAQRKREREAIADPAACRIPSSFASSPQIL